MLIAVNAERICVKSLLPPMCTCLMFYKVHGLSIETCTYKIILNTCILPTSHWACSRIPRLLSSLLFFPRALLLWMDPGRSHMTFLCSLILWRPSAPADWPSLAHYPAVSMCGRARGLPCAPTLILDPSTRTLAARPVLLEARVASLLAVSLTGCGGLRARAAAWNDSQLAHSVALSHWWSKPILVSCFR